MVNVQNQSRNLIKKVCDEIKHRISSKAPRRFLGVCSDLSELFGVEFIMKTNKPKSQRILFVFTIISAVIVSFVLGLLLFNFVIMPWLVRQGQEKKVPDVIGKNLLEAKKIIAQQGFHLGEVREVFDTTYPVGYVSAQKPKAGGYAKIGRIISINVSKGQKKVHVPFVAKLGLEQAKSILEDIGLKTGPVESLQSSLIPPGRVITTLPEPGSEAEQGDLVRIYLSSSPPPLNRLMPNLVGLNISVAQESIRTRSLILGEVKELDSDEITGRVIIQYPEEGMRINPGDTVKLIIAKKRVK